MDVCESADMKGIKKGHMWCQVAKACTRKVHDVQMEILGYIKHISSITVEKAVIERQWDTAYSELQMDIKRYEDRIKLIREAQIIIRGIEK